MRGWIGLSAHLRASASNQDLEIANMTTQTNIPFTLAWAGTGRMGYAMAERLLTAGHELLVWNRTKSKAEPLEKQGARIANRLQDLGERDIVFVISATGHEVKQLLFGSEGLLSGINKPKMVIDLTSMSPEDSSEIRKQLDEMGIAFIAAPVSGNAKVIKAGKLSIVASGPNTIFLDAAPYLRSIGQTVTYVGEGELARIAKICHNVMLGVVTQNLSEILILAQSFGMKRSDFLNFLNQSVMGSVFTRYKAPALTHLDFEVTFTPKLMLKDLDLGLSAARQAGVPMPTTSTTRDQVQTLIGHGFDQDFSQLLLLEALAAGLELEPEDTEIDDGL
jgi:3-hydroxyisobutyrate dehydrogenase-like beta-hydroxyacid dehydrogenase